VHAEQGVVAGRAGDRLDGPGIEVHDALGLQRAGADFDRLALLRDPPPSERPEEADRVVLRAVALATWLTATLEATLLG
jgi:hypothetical protein